MYKQVSQKGIVPKSLLSGLFLALLVSLSACSTGILGTGGTWQASEIQQSVRALAVHPQEPQKIYASTEQGNIFISTDSGQHWTERSAGLPLPNPVSALALDMAGKKIYAATEKGLFVSTETVERWQMLSTPDTSLPSGSYTALHLEAGTPATLYVGTERDGVFASMDEGQSWQSLRAGLPPGAAIKDLAYDPVRRHLWVVTSTAAGIYRSDDDGASWRPFNRGIPADVIVNVLQPADASSQTQGLTYVGTDKGIFLSQDSGAYWIRGETPLPAINIHAILIDFRSANAATVCIGTSIGALSSRDGGQNWSSIASGLPRNESVYALAIGGDNYTHLYAATTDKLFLFPGQGGEDPVRFVYLIVIIVFFYLLYHLARRTGFGRNQKRKAKSPINKNS